MHPVVLDMLIEAVSRKEKDKSGKRWKRRTTVKKRVQAPAGDCSGPQTEDEQERCRPLNGWTNGFFKRAFGIAHSLGPKQAMMAWADQIVMDLGRAPRRVRCDGCSELSRWALCGQFGRTVRGHSLEIAQLFQMVSYYCLSGPTRQGHKAENITEETNAVPTEIGRLCLF